MLTWKVGDTIPLGSNKLSGFSTSALMRAWTVTLYRWWSSRPRGYARARALEHELPRRQRQSISRERITVSIWLWILIIVIVVLAVGYFFRGRMSR